MSPTEIYAICVFGVFLTLFLSNKVAPHAVAISKSLCIFASKTLGYSFLINRHALLGPWTVSFVLVHAIYLGGNIVSLSYGVKSLSQAASRAGTMVLVNMAPIYLATHLSFLADLFGMTLRTYRLVHTSCGLMAVAHVVFHGVVSMTRGFSIVTAKSSTLYAITGAALMLTLVILSISLLRRRVYETFLRVHQALAAAVAFCTIKHLLSLKDYEWLPLYVFAGIFCALAAVHAASILYRNQKWGHPCPRITIQLNHGTVNATIYLSRSVAVDAGQYINLWVPSVSFLSSHPFIVTSWSPVPQSTIDLVIEPRRGFTSKLHRRAEIESAKHIASRTFFSGPHGRCIPVWEFDCVLLFATGFGIAPMLPYLKKLWHGYKERKSHTKRIHLIWQGHTIDLRRAVGPIINGILHEDRTQKSYILYISIYSGTNMKKETSQHGRYTIYPGKADVDSIIEREATGNFVQSSLERMPVIEEESVLLTSGGRNALAAHSSRTANETSAGWDCEESSTKDHAMHGHKKDRGGSIRKILDAAGGHGRTLVLTSAEGVMRDNLRRAVRNYLHRKFELEEVDYQPD